MSENGNFEPRPSWAGEGSEWRLVWRDEFDGPSSLPDLKKWTPLVYRERHFNNELQTYPGLFAPDGSPVAEVRDGSLCITAREVEGRVYSARIAGNLQRGWQYGCFEASICLPRGRGTWPAFWMMPAPEGDVPWPLCGEIDIMEEVGTDPNEIVSSIHTAAYNHMKNTHKTCRRVYPNMEGAFHRYGCEWSHDAIRMFVDGELLFTYENDGTGNVETWPYDKPFHILLNLAWGGFWGGKDGVDPAALPAEMKIDWVRVWQ